jgi:hypothetical protein
MNRVEFPGESPEYRQARARLLLQEVDLRRAMEAVAEARWAASCQPTTSSRDGTRTDRSAAFGGPSCLRRGIHRWRSATRRHARAPVEYV